MTETYKYTSAEVQDTKVFDFGAFSSIDVQETGYAMPVLKPNGEPSGMVITVLGPNSSKRKLERHKRLNERLDKRGEARVTAEQVEEQSLLDAVTATAGWRFPPGFEGPEFTPANVRMIYERHNDILVQVIAAMDSLKNFTKASPKK